jgi:hypothetical protein
VDLDRDVLDLDVLALALRDLLEWQQLLGRLVPGNGLAVEDKRLGALLDRLSIG